jgi:hypothetical protein
MGESFALFFMQGADEACFSGLGLEESSGCHAVGSEWKDNEGKITAEKCVFYNPLSNLK